MSGLTEKTVAETSRVLTALPAQFLALVLLNLAFLAGLLWFLNGVDARRVAFEQSTTQGRERLLGPMLAACVEDEQAAAERKPAR